MNVEPQRVAPGSGRRLSLRRLGINPGDTFASLSVRNFRLFFWGQGLSVSGNWMQMVGQAWLVLQLSDSGTVLGLVTSARFVPILLLGPWGGVVADRMDKRRLLLITQSVSSGLAILLALIVATGQARLWMVYVVALGLGLTNVFDQPTQQSFVSELVPPRMLLNAVTLTSLTQNVGRVVGPAVAGVVIASLGLVPCFVFNAVSFAPALLTLLIMDQDSIRPPDRVERSAGELRAGIRYARHAPELALPLMMVAFVGALAWEFPISLPLMAHGPFHGGAGTYGAMMTAMGGGAVIGGLIGASRMRVHPVVLSRSCLAWGVAIALAAVAPNLGWEIAALIFVGYGSVSFNSLAKTVLQLGSEPHMRGRVMALWAVAWAGTSPIGGPLVGAVGQWSGARWSLAVGSLSAIAAGLFTYRRLARATLEVTADQPGAEPSPATPVVPLADDAV